MSQHDVRLTAPRDIVADGLAIVQRQDDDFIGTTLAQLRSASGRSALRGMLSAARTAPKNGSTTLKLYQPIQRQFHLALLEAWCDTLGTPRVDPQRIESAGMVLRRLRDGNTLEGWVKRQGQLLGWARIDRLGGPTADPTPVRRLEHRSYGVSLDRAMQAIALEREDALLEETTTPLFVAPPDVCSAAGKTLYYGVVPTTSSEIAALPAPESEVFGDDFGPGSAAFTAHLMGPLQGLATRFSLAGETITSGWAAAIEMPGPSQPEHISSTHWNALRSDDAPARMRVFMTTLRQLASEFDAFGDSPHSAAIMAELALVSLPLLHRPDDKADRAVSAASFLRAASRVLLEHDASAPGPEMPVSWPALGSATTQRLHTALSAAMRARFAAVKGAPGRFDEPGARYLLRCFVRLKPEGDCPVRTVWSAYSEPFVIAPWYDGSGAPPTQIALPDPTPELLRSLKPNVSFVVPPALQGLLMGNPKDLMDGKKGGSPLTVGWICSFSLPIITLCAFIVLNIFLTLFDLIFSWMFHIKVCIPFPKRKEGE